MKRWRGFWFPGIFWMVGLAHAGSFLDIRPPVVEISEVPGKTVKGSFYLKNPGAEFLPVVVEVEDGWKHQVGRPSPVVPSEWLVLKIPKKLRISPKSEKKVSYRVRVPAHLLGESLALVFFSVPSEPGPRGARGSSFGTAFRFTCPPGEPNVSASPLTRQTFTSFPPAVWIL